MILISVGGVEYSSSEGVPQETIFKGTLASVDGAEGVSGKGVCSCVGLVEGAVEWVEEE